MLKYTQGRGKSPNVKKERKKKMIKYEFDGKKVEWSICGEDKYFSTDNFGRGIFKISGSDRTQLLGTAQFSLAGLTKSSARAKIRKFMSEREC